MSDKLQFVDVALNTQIEESQVNDKLKFVGHYCLRNSLGVVIERTCSLQHPTRQTIHETTRTPDSLLFVQFSCAFVDRSGSSKPD